MGNFSIPIKQLIVNSDSQIDVITTGLSVGPDATGTFSISGFFNPLNAAQLEVQPDGDKIREVASAPGVNEVIDFTFTTGAADGDVVDVTGTSVTAANVIDELGKVVDAIPAALYGKEDLYIYVSQHIARAYVRALGGFGANGLGANGVNNAGTTWFNGGDLAFDGVKLFVCSGMSDNTMIAAQKSNLYFGTGLLSDHNEVKLIDMADLDGSQNVRVVMRFTSGVQFGIGADIVLYS